MANIFSLFGSIFIDNEAANKSIDETTQKADKSGKSMGASFKSIIGGVGKAAAAVGAGAVAIGASIYGLAAKTADTAGEISDASKRAGMSAEEYQKWAYAANLSGVEASKLESLMVKQQKSFADAKDGSEAMAEAYQRLGIDIASIGSSEEAFNQVMAALAEMEDETTRNAIANDIFGKSYADLSPLLAEGAAGIEAIKQEAVDLGSVMSNEAVDAGDTLGDTIDKIKAAGSGIFNQLGGAVLPLVQKVLDTVLDKMPSITSIFDRLIPVVVSLADKLLPVLLDLIDVILPVLLDLITELMPVISEILDALLPVLLSLLKNILPIIMQVVKTILPLVVKLLQAIMPILDALAPLLELIFGLLNTILTPLLELISAVLEPIIALLGEILSVIIPALMAILQPLIELIGGALKGAFSGILTVVGTVKNVFMEFMNFIKNVFSGNWSAAWDNVKNIFSNIWNGIKNIGKGALNGLISLFETGLNAIIGFINGITGGLSNLWDWAGIPAIPKIPKVNIPRLRIGIDNVPYDDFPALLHKGERVLRASEAEAYEEAQERRKAGGEETPSQGGGKKTVINVTINIEHFAGSKEDADEFANELLERLQEILDRKEAAF